MEHRRDITLGPVRVPDGVLTLRSPRRDDAAAWSAARLANREWLEPAFPAWGGDWAAEQSEVAWVQRWWRLSRAARHGLAKPFVILLDGELIGELGVDAVDPVSGAGEASVWMTRSHGSSAVMGAASLLLIVEAFSSAHPVDMLLSPVATTSRRGRSPGLTAAGLRIEGTYPRKVGTQGLVDHDMWVIANNPAALANARAVLTNFPAADPVPEPPSRMPAAAVARAVVREARAAVADLAGRVSRRQVDDGTRPVRVDGVDAGTVRVTPDLGTGIAEVLVTVQSTGDGVRRALTEVVGATLAEVTSGLHGAHLHPAVRVPTGSVLPDADLLTGLGLTLVATFAGNPDGPRAWPGEQRWEPERD